MSCKLQQGFSANSHTRPRPQQQRRPPPPLRLLATLMILGSMMQAAVLTLLLLSAAQLVAAKPYETASCGPSNEAQGYSLEAEWRFPSFVSYSKSSNEAEKSTTLVFKVGCSCLPGLSSPAKLPNCAFYLLPIPSPLLSAILNLISSP